MAHAETHLSGREGWLRAAVLGANDGILSTAGLVLGVAAADASVGAIATAGIAGLVAGALSMAAGEYVSVSSQRDAQLADLALERRELAADPGRGAGGAGRDLPGARPRPRPRPPRRRGAHRAATRSPRTRATSWGSRTRTWPGPSRRRGRRRSRSRWAPSIPLLAITLTPEPARIPLTVVADARGARDPRGPRRPAGRRAGRPRRAARERVGGGGDGADVRDRRPGGHGRLTGA